MEKESGDRFKPQGSVDGCVLTTMIKKVLC